jgi:cytochrome c6
LKPWLTTGRFGKFAGGRFIASASRFLQSARTAGQFHGGRNRMTEKFWRAGVKCLLALGLTVWLVPSLRAQADAEKNYKAKCAGCHGADGSGNTSVAKTLGVRDFQSPEVQKESEADFADIIAKGKNKMPKYADKLKDAEIKDLAAYARSLGKKK